MHWIGRWSLNIKDNSYSLIWQQNTMPVCDIVENKNYCFWVNHTEIGVKIAEHHVCKPDIFWKNILWYKDSYLSSLWSSWKKEQQRIQHNHHCEASRLKCNGIDFLSLHRPGWLHIIKRKKVATNVTRYTEHKFLTII